LRVHEVAKELELTNKALINVLSKIDIEVKSHASALSDDDFAKVKKYLAELENPTKEESAVEVKVSAEDSEVEEAPKKKSKKKQDEEEPEEEIRIIELKGK